MLKIYHNPRCKKSCEGLKYIQEKGIEHSIVKYLETGLSEIDLNEIILKTNKKPIELIRTQEEFFKKELKGKNFADNELVKIIIENPIANAKGKNKAPGIPTMVKAGAKTAKIQSRISNFGNAISLQASQMASALGFPISRCW